MQRLPPALFKIGPNTLSSPKFPHNLVIAPYRLLLAHRAEDIVRCFAAIQRRDQRLHQRNRAIQ